MQSLLKKIDQLSNQISNASKLNPVISQGTVGWHIEHSCLVIIKITETIQKSDPSTFHSKFNFRKWIVFILGKFPRGRANAPASVLPNDHISVETLQLSIQKTRAAIQALQSCQKNQYFLHPLFGNLNTAETPRFLRIHTNHHLRIIQDIIKT